MKYEYVCKKCKTRFTITCSIDDRDKQECIYCGNKKIKRVLEAPSIAFIGDDFTLSKKEDS